MTTVLGRGVLCFAPPVFFTWSLPASTFVDPLLWLLVVMGAGLYLARGSFTGHRGKRAFRVLLGAWLALWLLSTPLVTALLLWQMEPWPADISPALEGASPERTALVPDASVGTSWCMAESFLYLTTKGRKTALPRRIRRFRSASDRATRRTPWSRSCTHGPGRSMPPVSRP